MNTQAKQASHRGPEISSQDDKQLLKEWQVDASNDAFAELVQRYSKPLHVYLSRFLGDRVAAEDVLQDTLLQFYLHNNSFDANRPLQPWLYTVARNQAIDYMRRNYRHRILSLDSTPGLRNQLDNRLLKRGRNFDERRSPEELVEAMEMCDWLRKQVKRLSQAQREVVESTYYESHTNSEAAKILGLPPGTVKSRNHASRARLLKAWKTHREQANQSSACNSAPSKSCPGESHSAA